MSVPISTLDRILTAQILVAWAGENGEDPRLGWWRTDLISEFGGKDLFQRLLPETWRWALLQAAREAAGLVDSGMRTRLGRADSIDTLYHWGLPLDEQLAARLLTLKRAGGDPRQALPGLAALLPDLDAELEEGWDRRPFADWVATHRAPPIVASPAGRRISGPLPEVAQRLDSLIGGLAPLGSSYPMPHLAR